MCLRYFHFDLSTHIILLDQQMQYVKIKVKGGFGKSLLAHQEPYLLCATRQLDLALVFSCVRWRKWLRFRAWSCGWSDAGLTEVSAPWSPACTPLASLGMESSVLQPQSCSHRATRCSQQRLLCFGGWGGETDCRPRWSSLCVFRGLSCMPPTCLWIHTVFMVWLECYRRCGESALVCTNVFQKKASLQSDEGEQSRLGAYVSSNPQ